MFLRLRRVPEMLLKIRDSIINHLNAFAFEELLHQRGRAKMMLPGEHAVAVYHPVGRHIFTAVMRSVHGPAHHTCRSFGAEIRCNCAIAGHPAVWNPAHHLINPPEEGIVFHDAKVGKSGKKKSEKREKGKREKREKGKKKRKKEKTEKDQSGQAMTGRFLR